MGKSTINGSENSRVFQLGSPSSTSSMELDEGLPAVEVGTSRLRCSANAPAMPRLCRSKLLEETNHDAVQQHVFFSEKNVICWSMCAYMHACIYVSLYLYVYIYINIYIYTHSWSKTPTSYTPFATTEKSKFSEIGQRRHQPHLPHLREGSQTWEKMPSLVPKVQGKYLPIKRG